MQYKINIKNWGRMFTVPCCVVDDNIKLASGNSIKVLLYLLCSNNNTFNSDMVSADTGVNIEEVDDAILYWTEKGVIENNNSDINAEIKSASQTIQNVSHIEANDPAKNSIAKKTSVKYTPKDIKDIVSKNEELSFLFDNIQMVLGKTINYNEQSSLIHMYEYYGYSASTLLMMFEYFSKIGKSRISYVERVAEDWSMRDITTHEDVEKEIIRLIDLNTYENKVKKAFGIDRKLTQKEASYIQCWSSWSFQSQMLEMAYERCINQTGKLSFPYINKILESWFKNNINTPEKIEEFDTAKKPSTTRTHKQPQNTNEHSYDLDKLFKKTIKTTKS